LRYCVFTLVICRDKSPTQPHAFHRVSRPVVGAELQLAKGVIRCGIEALLQEAGIAAADLDRVIIAGAFGTYIAVESAITIGLLPVLPLERISQVGNAAGTGARLALISRAQRDQAQEIARRVRYLELARTPRFMRNFAEAMYL